MNLILATSLFLFLIAQGVHATDCPGLLGVTTTAMPLSGLAEAGVAEIHFSSRIGSLLKEESETLRRVPGDLENWDFPKFNAVRASFSKVHEDVAQDILAQLRNDLPLYSWAYIGGNGRGQPQGPLPLGGKTSMLHPIKYVEGWHRDTIDAKADPAMQLFLDNKLNNFVVRVTVALPLGETPSTWTKPVRGTYKDKPIQVDPNLGVAFVMNFIWHTTPQFDGEFRYLYVMDFEAARKDPSP